MASTSGGRVKQRPLQRPSSLLRQRWALKEEPDWVYRGTTTTPRQLPQVCRSFAFRRVCAIPLPTNNSTYRCRMAVGPFHSCLHRTIAGLSLMAMLPCSEEAHSQSAHLRFTNRMHVQPRKTVQLRMEQEEEQGVK